MKKLFLSLALIIGIGFVQAQKKKTKKLGKVKYETIDYLNDSSRVVFWSEPINSRVGIKIYNINKKLVDINSDIQKKSFNQEVPKLFEIFSKTSFPTPDEESSGDIEQFYDKETSTFLNKDSIVNSPISDKLKERFLKLDEGFVSVLKKITLIEEDIRLYAGDYQNAKVILQYHSDLILLQNVCNKSFDDILKEVHNLTKTTFNSDESWVSEEIKALLVLSDTHEKYKIALNRILNELIESANSHKSSLTKKLLPSELDKINLSINKLNEELSNLESELKKRKNPKLKKLLDKVIQLKTSNPLKNKLLDIEYNLENLDLKKVNEIFTEFENTEKKELFKVFDYFNESNYTYYLNPESITEDLTVLTVNITPKENVPCPPAPKSYELKIRAKSGIKIDFSTGFFGNFGGNDFLDQSYKYEDVTDEPDKTKIVRNDSKNSIFPSIGALMHVYCRNGKDFQLAGSFGVSTKELDKINYHFGPSLIFGYSRRVILSGGITLTQSTLIDDKFEVNEIIDVEDAPDEIPTDSFNRLGFFLSFTYNLSAK